MRFFGIRIAGLLVMLAVGEAGLAEPVTTLLYASPYSPNHPFSLADRTWMQWIERRSQGLLRIRPIWSGALISSDQSLTELRHGVADIGLITPIYVRGGEQLIRIQAGFYSGATRIQQQVALYRCLAARFEEYAHELAGLHVLAVQGGSLPGIVTREQPIVTLESLKGLRLRAPTELLGVLRDLGADPVTLPMSQVYSALAKRVIDGVIASPDTLESLHFSEVAKYYSRLAVPRGAYPSRAVGARRWDSLTRQQRELLDSSTAVWEEALAAQTARAVAAGEVQARRDGVRFTSISAEDQQRFDLLYGRDAERNARALADYGIDAVSVLAYARQLTAGLKADDAVVCSP